MLKYDPELGVDKETWLNADEGVRIDAVVQYHKDINIRVPNIRIHAIVHQVVESQLAEGIEQVQQKLEELMADGLSRHNAIHAIATALTGVLFNIIRNEPLQEDGNQAYFKKLEKVTAESWLNFK
ncbi:MAG TPA: hypothetical protein PLP19_05335 [bacterium]|nr:hypothetical protein [bacterium]HPN42894.1 hypothetical protein [bacterium]